MPFNHDLFSYTSSPLVTGIKIEHLSCTSYLCHLHLPLALGVLCVGVVVCLYQQQVSTLRVDHKLARCIIQGVRHL